MKYIKLRLCYLAILCCIPFVVVHDLGSKVPDWLIRKYEKLDKETDNEKE
jgi:hypothetical protein